MKAASWADPEQVGHVAARLTIRAVRYLGKLLLIAPIILCLSLVVGKIDPQISFAQMVRILYLYQVAIDVITLCAKWGTNR